MSDWLAGALRVNCPLMRAMSLLTSCTAIASQALGDLYVSGFNSGGVYRFDDSGAPISGGVFIATGTGGLSLPHGVMRLADGTFIVASAGTDEVLRYSNSGAFVSKFIANGQNGVPALTLDYPVDFAIGPGGDLFVTSQINDRVVRFNAITGAYVSTFIASGTVDGPSGLAWHPTNGDLYVVGRFGDHVLRCDQAGSVVAGFSPAAFGEPFGVAIHPTSGVIYAVDGGPGHVRRMDATTGATLSTVSGGLGFPIGARFGPGGDLFVASFGGDRIARFDGITGAVKTDLVTAATAASVGLDGPNFFNFIPPFTAQESWRLLNFGTSANTGNAADDADPDHDGLPNLLEFATSELPNTATPPVGGLVQNGAMLEFTYPRNTDAVSAGMAIIVEWSDTLEAASWSIDAVSESILSTTGNTQQVKAGIPTGASGRRFVRLRVQ